jgi:hypothetical protein
MKHQIVFESTGGVKQLYGAANGGWTKPTATLSLIQALAMLALWSVASTGNAIVSFDIIAFGTLVIIVIDLAIRLTLRMPCGYFCHG